jgi:serine phosphatase RsbU (regulator of sigma subunit)/tetratricopeptide (TPR) repeat protein
MRSLLLIIFLSQFLGGRAQQLDKNYYLLDSLDRSKISESDMKVLDIQMKNYVNAKNDTTRLLALSRIVEECYDEKIWTRYNTMMLKIAREKQKGSTGMDLKFYRQSEALGLNNIGYYFFNHTSHIDSAEHYYKLGLEINEDIQSYNNMVVSYSNLANVYQNNGKLLNALELYLKALSYEQQASDKTGIMAALNNISNIYLYLNDTTQALLYLKRGFLVAQKLEDKNMKAHVLHNMGILLAPRNYHEGLRSLQESLQLRKEIGDKKGIAQTLIGLSGFANEQFDHELADRYLKEAEPIIKELKNPLLLGLFYRTRSDAAKTRKDWEGAIPDFLKAVECLKEANAVNDLLETIKGDISLFDEPKYRQKKLELIELYYNLSKIQNKNSTQRAALKLQYESQLKLKDTEYRAEQQLREEKVRSEKRKQSFITTGIGIILLITVVFCFFIFKALKANREKTKVIDKQKHLVEEKQKEIIDSINYSKRIQNSFIPSDDEFSAIFPNSFVIYKPKDIVSGDFYWMLDTSNYPSIKRNLKAIAVADCTGHGVPGAMLSMLGASILNQAILENSVQSPADILNFLNMELKKNLRSKNNEIIRDGMDIACCLFDKDTLKMQFAGASNPCWILRDGKVIELKADKHPVTASVNEEYGSFTNKEFQLQTGDMVILFTDGFADQFGGPRGKKFMYSRLEKLIASSASLSASEQKEFLTKDFDDWKGQLDQVDDVCLMGIRI